jgi:hypothetical protein
VRVQAYLLKSLGYCRSPPKHIAAGATQRGAARSTGNPVPVFEVVLERSCCRADPNWQQRGGNEWDTVKPLQLHRIDLARTILVDDSARKLLPEEVSNCILVPGYEADSPAESASTLRPPVGQGAAWRRRDGEGPPVLRMLCVLLREAVRQMAGTSDMRAVLPGLQRQLDEVCVRAVRCLPSDAELDCSGLSLD